MNTLVTGGSGVVGRALVSLLVAEGRTVRVLARSQRAADTVASLGAHPVAGDILDFDSLTEAMSGCEVAYHVAGLNDNCLADPTPLFRANVDGARHALRAAQAAGVRRMVHTSSATALGEQQGTTGSEQTVHRGHYLSNYERSKYEAEQMLFAERSDVEVVMVNPSSVQGPGRATGTGRLFLDLVNGDLPALVDSRFSIVDIDDCARGHLLAEQRGVPGARYVLNGFTSTTAEMLELLSRITGLDFALPNLPVWLARGGAVVVEAASRLVGRQPRFCREMIRVMTFGHAYDGSKAVRDLGLVYTPAEETIRRTVAWFVEQGLVSRDLPGLE